MKTSGVMAEGLKTLKSVACDILAPPSSPGAPSPGILLSKPEPVVLHPLFSCTDLARLRQRLTRLPRGCHPRMPDGKGYDSTTFGWRHLKCPDAKFIATCPIPLKLQPGETVQNRFSWESSAVLHIMRTANGHALLTMPLANTLQDVYVDAVEDYLDAAPAWSPDSQQFAFWGTLSGEHKPHIRLIAVDSGEVICWSGTGSQNPAHTTCYWLRWAASSQWLIGYVGMSGDDYEWGADTPYEAIDNPMRFHAHAMDASSGRIMHTWGGCMQESMDDREVYNNLVWEHDEQVLLTIRPVEACLATCGRPCMTCIVSEKLPVSVLATPSPCGSIFVDCLTKLDEAELLSDDEMHARWTVRGKEGQRCRALVHLEIGARCMHLVAWGSWAEYGSVHQILWLPPFSSHHILYACITEADRLIVVDGKQHHVLIEWSFAELACWALDLPFSALGNLLDTLKLPPKLRGGQLHWSQGGQHLITSGPDACFMLTF